jgi:hypothetical protein
MPVLRTAARTYGSLRLGIAVARAIGLRRALQLRHHATRRRRARMLATVGWIGAGTALIGAAVLIAKSTPDRSDEDADE